MASQVIRISSEVEVPYLTYQGQPVLTLAMIDKLHSRVDGTARRNFSENREYFIEGEDYFHLSQAMMEAMDEFRTSANPKGILLITESGYLLRAKSFTDKLAWTIQRQLVKVYFRAKALVEAVAQPTQPNHPILTEKTLTPAQYIDLKNLVWKIGRCFHTANAGHYAMYKLLREHFCVGNTAKIPADKFEEVMGVLSTIEGSSIKFHRSVLGVEELFFRERLQFSPKMIAEMARFERYLPE